MSTARTRHAVAVPALLAALVAGLTVASPAPAHARETPGENMAPPLPIGKRVTLRSRAVMPVTSYRLTGEFGDVSGLWSSVHTGLDFATAEGSPLRAVQDGVVVSTGYDGAYGTKTVLRLTDGTELWYCHQSAVTVAPGQRVAAGEVIGYVGSTGNVTGPHLHLEVRPGGGEAVDPYAALVALGLSF